MAVSPTKGSCTFAMAFQIERGSYGAVSLDGLGFIVLGLTPEAMGKGNWSVGLIADERASAEQRDAITAIASGAAGGPMAALSGLVGKFLGVESAPIRFDRSGVKWSVKAASLVDMAAEGAKGINPDATEPLHLDNTGHPAADRFALAHASKSHVHALGLAWDDVEREEQRTVRAVFLAECVAASVGRDAVSPAATASSSATCLVSRHRARLGVSRPSRSSDVVVHGARPDDGGDGHDDGHAVDARPTCSSRSRCGR